MNTFQLMMVSFLLVAITTTSGVAGDGTNVVYCGEGEPVKPNVPYYISFMTSDYDSWICRSGSGSCPSRPVMYQHPPTTEPQQIMFKLLPSSNDTVVRESTPVKIKFVNRGNCGKSAYWRVAWKNDSEGDVLLKGSSTTSSYDTTFYIHYTDQYYKFSVGDDRFSGVGQYPINICTSNNYPISMLIATRMAAEMEVYFYRYTNTTS